MVRTEFELPDVGEGVAEGELVAWLVGTDEHVVEDQPIAEVETDKALVEIPSAYDGVIVERCAQEGDTVPVGDVLVVFEVDEGAAEATDTVVPDEEPEETTEPTERPQSDRIERGDEPGVSDERVFAPPSVRNAARELGVPLSAVAAPEPGDRITERDVREAARRDAGDTVPLSDSEPPEPATERESNGTTPDGTTSGRAPSSSTGNAPISFEAAGRDRTLAMPATRRLASEKGLSLDDIPASEQRDGEPFVTPADVRTYSRDDASASSVSDSSGTDSPPTTEEGPRPGDRIPYTGVRRTIGEKMATSKYTAPHVSHHDEVDVSELVEARSRLKPEAQARETKLTYMPFAVKAVVAGLKEVPAINAELDEENEEIVLHDEYNIGIAVASDAGLMVPVIDNADQKGLLELADEISDKAARARDRSIGLEEMQGGTFTITNVGAVGGEYASPIINHPEAGILALGSLKERPWAEDGEIVARETLPISMSVDHRIVDGAEAARFTNEVKRYLNNPELLLLE
ncbi:branched-chain alpha-keto acid dehydrogenase subunit E2 (plasmid) [Halostagnicola larsenii XH-48]|uniref:Branched-chain alpha-keto acid dehydrogenase subunit E2 n=1 Tax=Halostagnicola larsenii XH-48 TaxID=797299 RepID=W0JRN0_9EURY|nr:2-oxo acid dehydrogenase subunit E2 [Halostagnicola larsenii]AHG01264.1 branched-chain alpha-keto acid dehydrogenase subunit E2 [Halostagnicola larsenii XH-48]